MQLWEYVNYVYSAIVSQTFLPLPHKKIENVAFLRKDNAKTQGS